MGHQILACRLGDFMIAVRSHKYGVGIHPKVTFVGDSRMKSELLQVVRYRVGLQIIFEFSDFEVTYQIGTCILWSSNPIVDTGAVRWLVQWNSVDVVWNGAGRGCDGSRWQGNSRRC